MLVTTYWLKNTDLFYFLQKWIFSVGLVLTWRSWPNAGSWALSQRLRAAPGVAPGAAFSRPSTWCGCRWSSPQDEEAWPTSRALCEGPQSSRRQLSNTREGPRGDLPKLRLSEPGGSAKTTAQNSHQLWREQPHTRGLRPHGGRPAGQGPSRSLFSAEMGIKTPWLSFLNNKAPSAETTQGSRRSIPTPQWGGGQVPGQLHAEQPPTRIIGNKKKNLSIFPHPTYPQKAPGPKHSFHQSLALLKS